MRKIIITTLIFTFQIIVAQNYKLYDNFEYGGKVYELKILNDEAAKSFKIQICDDDDPSNCKISGNMVYDYNQDMYIAALTRLVTNFDSAFTIAANSNLKIKWVAGYDKIMKDLNKQEIITQLYDHQDLEFSGGIKIKKKLTLVRADMYLKKNKDNVPWYEKKGLEKNKTKKDDKKEIPETVELNIQKASIRFFNNRVNSIAVVGRTGKDTITINNNKYSIPFRYLNRRGSYLKVEVGEADYVLEWNDLLDYNPVGSEFNYAVKNKNYELKINEEVKVESRNLFDYFTAIIFTDFLGLNNTGNNSLLMAEGRVIIPMALVNKRQFNNPQYFEAYLNTSLYNGQEEGSGFVTLTDPVANEGEMPKIPIFDFFKRRNVEAGLNLGIFSYDWKGISSTITLDYGIQFYRTKLRYVKDSLNTHDDLQVYSIGQGPKLKFDIRPQVNFGADINVGLMGFKYNGLNKELDYSASNFKKDVLENDKTLYNTFYIVSNFYTKLNNDNANGGIYFRLGAYYDFNTYSVSPQIMAGYATNLTTFINKFKHKDETQNTNSIKK